MTDSGLMVHAELRYALAEAIDRPAEFIVVRAMDDRTVDFYDKRQPGVDYWAKLKKNRKGIKKHSTRRAWF